MLKKAIASEARGSDVLLSYGIVCSSPKINVFIFNRGKKRIASVVTQEFTCRETLWLSW
jgi:hypothetical protein